MILLVGCDWGVGVPDAADMGLVVNDGSLPPLAMAILGSCTTDELDPPKKRAGVKKLQAKLSKVAFA